MRLGDTRRRLAADGARWRARGGVRALSQVAVDGANTPKAAQLRQTFAIPKKPKNLKDTTQDWARDVSVWIKLVVDFGIKLD